MKWLVYRMCFLLGISIVLCLLAIGIWRINQEPNKLQALGFDVCNGGPCYRGIGPGMALETPKLGLPEVFQDGQSRVSIAVSSDGKIAHIIVQPASGRVLPLDAGEVIEKLGPPCHVYIQFEATGNIPTSTLLYYPNLSISVGDPHSTAPFDLAPETLVNEIAFIGGDPFFEKCLDTDGHSVGPWHGFASGDVYINRFRREFDMR